jgi:autotransporter-associated beta strand protein
MNTLEIAKMNSGLGFHRWFALLAAPFCVCPLTAKADYESEILSDSPISYYRFNDSVATDGLDATIATNLGSLGTAGNGSYNGIYTRGIDGAITGDTAILFSQLTPTAIDFRGSVTIPANAALNPSHTAANPFSVECWVKPTTTTSTLLTPVNSMSFTTGRAGYLIYQNGATWQLRIGNKASTTAYILNGGTVVAGQWQHLVATYSGGLNGTMTLYVNGISVGSLALDGAGYEANDNGSFVIGGTSLPNRTFDGAVDEVAFYASELSSTRITQRFDERSSNPAGYSAHVLADSPVGYWRLNEGPFVPRTPPVALNQGSLGAAADGGYYAGSKNTNTGPDSSSGFLGFGGSNSALALQTANGHVGTALGLLNNRSAFTVSGWVKRGATKSTRGGYFGQNDLLEFGDANSGASIEAWINARGGNIVTPFSFPDDTWGFIALTADTTQTTLYLNGVQVGQMTGALANYGTNAFNFNIGGGGIFGTSGDYFRGDIDEVAVFDKALTAGRVKQLYDTALGNVAPTADAPTVSPGNLIAEGKSYSLTVDPAGTPPFTYQWYRDGAAITGAKEKTYNVPVAVLQSPATDPFAYKVEVTNGVTSITTAETFVFVSPGLVWRGNDGTNPSFWDISTTSNWKTAASPLSTKYTDDFAVNFDDTAVSTLVDVRTDVSPQEVFFNNSTKDFTLAGTLGNVGIAGATGITKSGGGLLTITASNIFTGPMVITGGTVAISSAENLGNSAGSLSISGATLHVTASHTLGRKASVPTTGNLVVDAGVELTAPGGFNGGGTLTKKGLGNLRYNAYVGGSFGGSSLVVEDGTLIMAGGAFNTNLGLSSITLKPDTLLLQPVGAYHALGGGYSATPVLNLETGSVYTVDQENYASVINLTGATINGASELRSDYGFQLNVLPSPTLSTWSARLNGVVEPININVQDGPGSVDFLISGSITNTQPMVKSGAGTMAINGNGSISGSSTIAAGTLTGAGSLAGPLVVSSGATIAPGNSIGTFTAGATTLGGTYQCEISGASSDLLKVNGNLTLSAGSVIQITSSSPTAPLFVICSYTGTLTDGGVSVTGVPAGYEVRQEFNSIMIVQAGLDFSPVLAPVPGAGSSDLSTNDFGAGDGGFTVSPPVTPETDWTYTPGSWRSNGQEAGFGDSNVSYLTSPPFTLTKSGIFALTFSHRFSFEVGFDGGVVEYNINGGAYKRVTASAFTQNGYNVSLGADAVAPLINQQAFGSNSPGHPAFITSTCRAGVGNAGDVVTVRFMSASDNNTSGALTPQGWEIDSYTFAEGLPGGFTLTWPVGVMQYSDNLLPPWTDITGTSPLFIDTSLAPKRFFRLKP